MYRATVEATTYSSCNHCSRYDQLQEKLTDLGVETERITEKRARKERYKLMVPDDVSIDTVREQVTETLLRGGPYQQVGTHAVGEGVVR